MKEFGKITDQEIANIRQMPAGEKFLLRIGDLSPYIRDDSTASYTGHYSLKVAVSEPHWFFRLFGVKPRVRIFDGNHRYHNALENGATPDTLILAERLSPVWDKHP